MRTAISAVLLLLISLAGCSTAPPAGGTPVFVDHRAGNFWNGKASLLEVSPDQRSCRVAVRDKSTRVQEIWVDCTHVHERTRS